MCISDAMLCGMGNFLQSKNEKDNGLDDNGKKLSFANLLSPCTIYNFSFRGKKSNVCIFIPYFLLLLLLFFDKGLFGRTYCWNNIRFSAIDGYNSIVRREQRNENYSDNFIPDKSS